MNGELYIFLKTPVAGRVKTRLGQEIGVGRATALFRVMAHQTVTRVSSGPWRTIVAIDPPSGLSGFENIIPPHLPRIAQASGDLGARMAAVFYSASRGPVVIIGADAPGIHARHIREAFARLRVSDAVFGPAFDGGFWLIGLAKPKSRRCLFKNVRWSSEHALRDVIATLPQRYSKETLSQLRDIDSAKDLHAMQFLSVS